MLHSMLVVLPVIGNDHHGFTHGVRTSLLWAPVVCDNRMDDSLVIIPISALGFILVVIIVVLPNIKTTQFGGTLFLIKSNCLYQVPSPFLFDLLFSQFFTLCSATDPFLIVFCTFLDLLSPGVRKFLSWWLWALLHFLCQFVLYLPSHVSSSRDALLLSWKRKKIHKINMTWYIRYSYDQLLHFTFCKRNLCENKTCRHAKSCNEII